MAIPAIVGLIARAGIPAAIKKYGTKAVKEAQKHAKDMTSKPTAGQKKINPVTKSQRANRETARRTAGAGALAAGGAYVKGKEEGRKSASKASGNDSRSKPSDFPTYTKKSESGAAFRKAFAEANAKGQKTFSFEGRRYSTDKK